MIILILKFSIKIISFCLSKTILIDLGMAWKSRRQSGLYVHYSLCSWRHCAANRLSLQWVLVISVPVSQSSPFLNTILKYLTGIEKAFCCMRETFLGRYENSLWNFSTIFSLTSRSLMFVSCALYFINHFRPRLNFLPVFLFRATKRLRSESRSCARLSDGCEINWFAFILINDFCSVRLLTECGKHQYFFCFVSFFTRPPEQLYHEC